MIRIWDSDWRLVWSNCDAHGLSEFLLDYGSEANVTYDYANQRWSGTVERTVYGGLEWTSFDYEYLNYILIWSMPDTIYDDAYPSWFAWRDND